MIIRWNLFSRSWKLLFFWKIAHYMIAFFIKLANYIKQKRFSVIAQSLVIKKQLCKITEILTIYLLSVPINFKHSKLIISINFVSWRMSNFASVWMSTKLIKMCVKIQAEFTVINGLYMMITCWERWIVPNITTMFAKLKVIDCSYLCCELMLFNFFFVHAMFIIFQKVFFVFNSLLLLFNLSKFSQLSWDFFSVLVNILFKDPVIKSSILFIKMDVVFKFAIMNVRMFNISTLDDLS